MVLLQKLNNHGFVSCQRVSLQNSTPLRVFSQPLRADLPLVLGETATAGDGGCPGLSNRYSAGFFWLDQVSTCLSVEHGSALTLTAVLLACSWDDCATVAGRVSSAKTW